MLHFYHTEQCKPLSLGEVPWGVYPEAPRHSPYRSLLFTSSRTCKDPCSVSQKETYCGEEAQLWHPVPRCLKWHRRTPCAECSAVPLAPARAQRPLDWMSCSSTSAPVSSLQQSHLLTGCVLRSLALMDTSQEIEKCFSFSSWEKKVGNWCSQLINKIALFWMQFCSFNQQSEIPVIKVISSMWTVFWGRCPLRNGIFLPMSRSCFVAAIDCRSDGEKTLQNVLSCADSCSTLLCCFQTNKKATLMWMGNV